VEIGSLRVRPFIWQRKTTPPGGFIELIKKGAFIRMPRIAKPFQSVAGFHTSRGFFMFASLRNCVPVF